MEAIGRDCVGAVQLLPEGATPEGWNKIACEPLNDEQIAGILQAVPSETGLADTHGDELFRIAIAGAQEKTAFTRYQGRWCRPHAATPTTHIFKLPLGLIGGSKRVDASDSVQNEWLCASIMAAWGFPVAPTSTETFDGQAVLIVERFDRAWMDQGTWIARMPHEDFCQAMGLPPDKKYESMGGPGIAPCVRLLQGSLDKDDVATFLLTQFAFCLLAATDGHAKNFSIFLQPGDAYEMTPVYDVLSMYPYYGTGPNQFNPWRAGPAMYLHSKNIHQLYRNILARHWHRLAMAHGGEPVWNTMVGLAESAGATLDQVKARLPQDFPERTWSAIASGVRTAATTFLDQLSDLYRA